MATSTRYPNTRAALDLYDRQPTISSLNFLQVTFWIESPTTVRGRVKNPTVEEIRAHVHAATEGAIHVETTEAAKREGGAAGERRRRS